MMEEMSKLNEKSKLWDGKFKKGWGNVFGEFLAQFVEEYIPTGFEILDLGCGPGRNLIPLVEQGFTNVVGLDLSKEGLNQSKKRLVEKNLKTMLVRGDSTSLPFSNEIFDFVFSIGVVHCNTWNGVEMVFEEISRILKSGKYFLFTGKSIKDNEKKESPLKTKGEQRRI